MICQPKVKSITSNFLQNNRKNSCQSNERPKTDLIGEPFLAVLRQDARHLALKSKSVNLILTSPAYWRKRDYKIDGQIGQEKTSEDFVREFGKVLREFKRVLKPSGSMFLNVGDTFEERDLADIPNRLVTDAKKGGWILRNRIVWVKPSGMPDSAQNRLASRHEFIFHFVLSHNYFYDLAGYAENFGNGANPGDVWQIAPSRNNSEHLAPFPSELVERVLTLACPSRVCRKCGEPFRREWRRTAKLNPNRPQAVRAMEIAKEHNLSEKHIAAIQAVGISDAGKAIEFQTGAGRNSAEVQELAKEAKQILGGYFREFTFAQREAGEWMSNCGHKPENYRPGIVLDPFVGTGTTLRVAAQMGFSAIGGDLKIYDDLLSLLKKRVS
jgi:DNA modification methylase